jgi:hypothetical protein
MGFLDSVLNDPATQQRVQDFIGRYQQQQPGLLGQLLGGKGGSGGASGLLASPAARAALGGIAAMLAKRALAGRH